MAVRDIPAAKVFACDGCGAEQPAGGWDERPQYWCDLHILRDAYDYQGCAVADGSVKLNLCLECGNAAATAVNRALDERRRASGIEAATADETRSGSAEGESPTGEAGDAQNTDQPS